VLGHLGNKVEGDAVGATVQHLAHAAFCQLLTCVGILYQRLAPKAAQLRVYTADLVTHWVMQLTPWTCQHLIQTTYYYWRPLMVGHLKAVSNDLKPQQADCLCAVLHLFYRCTACKLPAKAAARVRLNHPTNCLPNLTTGCQPAQAVGRRCRRQPSGCRIAAGVAGAAYHERLPCQSPP
jgi:hypothetical protein